MTSERDVWVFLPGEVAPTLCGRFEHWRSPAGQSLGSFVYGRRYLESRFALALDPVALPLREQLFETAGAAQGVFGVFADAGPDDWGRYVIDRQHGVQSSPIGYLRLSQDDRVGNLCFSSSVDEPVHLPDPVSCALLDEAWAVVAGLEEGRPIPSELAHRIRANTAMGGARPKLTVADGRAQWLAKFPSRRDDPRWSQARVEAAMLDLARVCKIDAARARLHVVDERGLPEPRISCGDVLLVERFDRTLAPSGAAGPQGSSPVPTAWLRDAYVSARTVMLSDVHGPHASYGGSYARLSRQLQRWSGHVAADRLELYRRMVFNCCISNTDDHDRNHGLLASEDGRAFRLAPAFDMVPRLHATARRYQAMNIGDHGAESTAENLLSAAAAFQIEHVRAQEIIDEVQTLVIENWRNCMSNRGLDELAIELLSPCFAPIPQSFDEIDTPIRQRPGMR
jgi:serine/threonine-protein kinase HipA